MSETKAAAIVCAFYIALAVAVVGGGIAVNETINPAPGGDVDSAYEVY